MNAFEAFCTFQAIKSHFTSKYDYFKYNGKVSAKPISFETRNDKWYYHKLSKTENLIDFLVSNAIEDNIKWVGDLMCEKGNSNYLAWLKRKESRSYLFKVELNCLEDDFKSNFQSKDGHHPPLYKKYRQGDLSIESLIILNDILKFIPKWNESITDTIVWPKTDFLIKKYRPFLKYDLTEYKKILKNYVI